MQVKIKEKRNNLGLIEVVDTETGEVIKRTKSVTAAAKWLNEQLELNNK